VVYFLNAVKDDFCRLVKQGKHVMLITILTFLLSALAAFYFNYAPITLPFTEMAILTIVGGSLQLFLVIFSNSFILIPLERLEQKLVPNLIELFRRDRFLQLGRFLLFLFPLISYGIAILLLIPTIPHKE
jgi:hypothetical protein